MRKFSVVLVLLAVVCCSTQPAFAGIGNKELESDFGFRVALMYAHNNLSAADGGVPNTPVAGTRDTSAASQANTEFLMPFSGRVLGLSVISNAALTAGIAHFQFTVNGVIATTVTGTGVSLRADPGLTTSNGTRNYTSLVDRFTKSSPYTFSAGDRIGVSMTADPGVAPTTADLVVTVIVDQNAQE